MKWLSKFHILRHIAAKKEFYQCCFFFFFFQLLVLRSLLEATDAAMRKLVVLKHSCYWSTQADIERMHEMKTVGKPKKKSGYKLTLKKKKNIKLA